MSSPVIRRSRSLIRASADEGGPPVPLDKAASTFETEFPPSSVAMPISTEGALLKDKVASNPLSQHWKACSIQGHYNCPKS